MWRCFACVWCFPVLTSSLKKQFSGFGVELRDRPAHSHDLTSIQHLWDELELHLKPFKKTSVPAFTNERRDTWLSKFFCFYVTTCKETLLAPSTLAHKISSYTIESIEGPRHRDPAGVHPLKDSMCQWTKNQFMWQDCHASTIWEWHSARRRRQRQLEHKQWFC